MQNNIVEEIVTKVDFLRQEPSSMSKQWEMTHWRTAEHLFRLLWALFHNHINELYNSFCALLVPGMAIKFIILQNLMQSVFCQIN